MPSQSCKVKYIRRRNTSNLMLFRIVHNTSYLKNYLKNYSSNSSNDKQGLTKFGKKRVHLLFDIFSPNSILSILLHTRKVTWKSSNEFPYVHIAINHFLPHSLQEIAFVIFLGNNYKPNNISNRKLVLTSKKKVISTLRNTRTRWKVYRFFLSTFFH